MSFPDPSEICYKTLDELCVQTVYIKDEIFQPNYMDESLSTLDDSDYNPLAVIAENSSTPIESSTQREKTTYPEIEHEILLPCIHCRRTISYENYEKHLAVHTSEQAAIVNRSFKMDSLNHKEMKPIAIEQSETTICPICNENVPTNTLKDHLTEHVNIPRQYPIEEVTLEEEITWCEDEETVSIDELPIEIAWSEKEEIDPIGICDEELAEPVTSEENVYENIITEDEIEETSEVKLEPLEFQPNDEVFIHHIHQQVVTDVIISDYLSTNKTIQPNRAKKLYVSPVLPQNVIEPVNEITVPCPLCHRVVSPINMEKHMSTHMTGNKLLDSANGLKRSTNSNLSVTNLQYEITGRNNLLQNYNFCKICKESIPLEEVVDHWVTHSVDSRIPCPICSQEFNHSEELKNHVVLHTKPFSCCHCDQRFKTYSELKEHQAIREDEKRFVCRICLRDFYQCFHMKLHHLAHHKDIKFSLESDVKEKDAVLEIKKQRLSCSYCKMTFDNYSALSNHSLSHKKDNIVSCILCCKPVPMESVAHRRKGVFMCSSCSTTLMNCEMNSANGNDNNNNNNNDDCSSNVVEDEEEKKMRPKLRRKCKVKPKRKARKSYICDDCNSSFATEQSLRQHCVTKNQNSKFYCARCRRCFIRLTCLKRHNKECRKKFLEVS